MQNQNARPAAKAAGPAPGMEIELKLSGQPERLKRAFSSTAIRGRATGRGQSKRLENVYYDTADQRLRARGLAFRVRKDGRRYYQTLKSNDVGGLAVCRGEWQNPLRSSEANGASMPIAEVELELLEGSPEALYALALELDALAPLRLETRSKSARGYALAAGAPPAWHKAEAPALEGAATVDQAIQAILRNCLQQWCANEAAALDGSDPEGVHQMRVAIRRL